MPRRKSASKRETQPDVRYNNKLVAKFINCMMWSGKKSTAQRVFYDALGVIGEKIKDVEPIAVFTQALENVKPNIEVRSKRVGGASYQVPMQGNRVRQQSLAIRWILGSCREKKGRPMHEKLAAEHPDVALLIVGGDGWGMESFTEALDASPVRSRILRPGYLDGAALAATLRGASVLAYPSRYEGFGFPPLQAMAEGVPVVATAAGAVPEVVGDAALRVPAIILIVGAIQMRIAAGGHPHILWQILAFLVLTAAEILVSVTHLEFAYTQAPAEMKSLLMCTYLGAISLGNVFTAAVNFFIQNPDGTSKLAGASYFFFFAAVMFVTALVFLPVARAYRGRSA